MTLLPQSMLETVLRFCRVANGPNGTTAKYLPNLGQCFKDLTLFSLHFDGASPSTLFNDIKPGEDQDRDAFTNSLAKFYKLTVRCLEKFDQLDDKARVSVVVRLQKYAEILLLHLHGDGRSRNSFFRNGALGMDSSRDKLAEWFSRDKCFKVPQGFYDDFTFGEKFCAEKDFDRYAVMIGWEFN